MSKVARIFHLDFRSLLSAEEKPHEQKEVLNNEGQIPMLRIWLNYYR